MEFLAHANGKEYEFTWCRNDNAADITEDIIANLGTDDYDLFCEYDNFESPITMAAIEAISSVHHLFMSLDDIIEAAMDQKGGDLNDALLLSESLEFVQDVDEVIDNHLFEAGIQPGSAIYAAIDRDKLLKSMFSGVSIHIFDGFIWEWR